MRARPEQQEAATAAGAEGTPLSDSIDDLMKLAHAEPPGISPTDQRAVRRAKEVAEEGQLTDVDAPRSPTRFTSVKLSSPRAQEAPTQAATERWPPMRVKMLETTPRDQYLDDKGALVGTPGLSELGPDSFSLTAGANTPHRARALDDGWATTPVVALPPEHHTHDGSASSYATSQTRPAPPPRHRVAADKVASQPHGGGSSTKLRANAVHCVPAIDGRHGLGSATGVELTYGTGAGPELNIRGVPQEHSHLLPGADVRARQREQELQHAHARVLAAARSAAERMERTATMPGVNDVRPASAHKLQHRASSPLKRSLYHPKTLQPAPEPEPEPRRQHSARMLREPPKLPVSVSKRFSEAERLRYKQQIEEVSEVAAQQSKLLLAAEARADELAAELAAASVARQTEQNLLLRKFAEQRADDMQTALRLAEGRADSLQKMQGSLLSSMVASSFSTSLLPQLQHPHQHRQQHSLAGSSRTQNDGPTMSTGVSLAPEHAHWQDTRSDKDYHAAMDARSVEPEPPQGFDYEPVAASESTPVSIRLAQGPPPVTAVEPAAPAIGGKALVQSKGEHEPLEDGAKSSSPRGGLESRVSVLSGRDYWVDPVSGHTQSTPPEGLLGETQRHLPEQSLSVADPPATEVPYVPTHPDAAGLHQRGRDRVNTRLANPAGTTAMNSNPMDSLSVSQLLAPAETIQVLDAPQQTFLIHKAPTGYGLMINEDRIITGVAGAAAAAGVRIGSRVTAIGGQPVFTKRDVAEVLRSSGSKIRALHFTVEVPSPQRQQQQQQHHHHHEHHQQQQPNAVLPTSNHLQTSGVGFHRPVSHQSHQLHPERPPADNVRVTMLPDRVGLPSVWKAKRRGIPVMDTLDALLEFQRESEYGVAERSEPPPPARILPLAPEEQVEVLEVAVRTGGFGNPDGMRTKHGWSAPRSVWGEVWLVPVGLPHEAPEPEPQPEGLGPTTGGPSDKSLGDTSAKPSESIPTIDLSIGANQFQRPPPIHHVETGRKQLLAPGAWGHSSLQTVRSLVRTTHQLSSADIADCFAELGFNAAADLVIEWDVDGAVINQLDVAGWEKMFADLGIESPEDRDEIAAWLSNPPPVRFKNAQTPEEIQFDPFAVFEKPATKSIGEASEDHGIWSVGKQFTAAKKLETRAGPEEFTVKSDAIQKGEPLQILEVRKCTIDASGHADFGTGTSAAATTGIRGSDALLVRCAKGWFGPILSTQCANTLTPVLRRATTTGDSVNFVQPNDRWLNDPEMHVYAPNSPKELAVCYVIEDPKEKGLWHLQIRGRSTPNSPAMSEHGKWSSPPGTVLTARKQAKSKDPHISISSGVSKAHHQRTSEHYVGKLRKDPAGKKTHIWDAGNSPDTKEGDSKWVKDKLPSGEQVSRPLRKELMCILQSSKSNRDTKRRLVVLVPFENAIPTPASRADRKAGRGELRLKDLYKTVGRDKMNSTHILDSILPEDDVDGAATSSSTGTASSIHDDQDGSNFRNDNGKKGGKKKQKNKVDDETASSSETLSFFDIGGVLVPIQKSSVNFQLGLFPGGDLVCQLSKRPTVRQNNYPIASNKSRQLRYELLVVVWHRLRYCVEGAQ